MTTVKIWKVICTQGFDRYEETLHFIDLPLSNLDTSKPQIFVEGGSRYS